MKKTPSKKRRGGISPVMTSGKPATLILTFALPLMLGNMFQQCYTIVDTMVVGKFAGVKSLAALGAADWLYWLMLSTIMGFAQGFSIKVAHRYGAEDAAGVRKAITISFYLSAGIAVFLTALSLSAARAALTFLNTPMDVLEISMDYLRIMFAALPVVMLYNELSSILRALGDGKTPLAAMVISSVVNIVLDLVFVVAMRGGVKGAALGTAIAQAVASLYCLAALRRIKSLRTAREDWIWDGQAALSLLKLGTPVAFQNIIIGVGGLAVQYVINGFGFIFMAGFTATNKLYGLLEVAATSFGYAVATFTGQNLGAERYDRIRAGVRSARYMALVTALVITASMLLFGKKILSLFISGDPAIISDTLRIAYTYLSVMSVMLWILYLLHLYRSALQGMGDTLTPMLSGIVELAMRVAVAMLLPLWIGEWGVYLAEVTAWTGAAALLICMYYVRIKALPRE